MLLITCCLDGQIKKEEMDNTCNMHGELRNVHIILVKELKGRAQLGEIGICVRIILK
jgi:hypothetical protein